MDLFQLWGTIGVRTQDAMNQLNSFQDRVGSVAQNIGNGTAAIGAKFEQIGTSMSKAGDKMVSVGKKTTMAVSAPIAGLGVAAMKTVMDFDDVMGTVASVTGATGSSFDQLRDKAKDLGATTRYKASEAAEGMQYLGMAGWDTGKILEGIPHMLNLASAGGLDLGRAADIASDTMSAFSIEATDAGHMADVFAKAASSSNTSVEQLGETMKYAAPVAATFGATLEQTSALAALMADKGIKSSMSGTAIRGGLTRMAAPAKQARKWMERLGLSFETSNGDMKDMNVVVRETSAALNTLGESEKLQAAKALFGQEAMAGWLAVLDTGPDKFDEFTDKLIKSSDTLDEHGNKIGSAAAMSAIREDNIGGAFRSMFSAIEGVAIEIGDVMKPTVKKIANQIQKIASWFIKLPEPIKKNVVVIGLLAAAFGPAMIAMGLMLKMTGTVFKSVGKLFKLFASGPRAITAATNAMNGFGSAGAGAGGGRAGGGRAGAAGGRTAGGACPSSCCCCDGKKGKKKKGSGGGTRVVPPVVPPAGRPPRPPAPPAPPRPAPPRPARGGLMAGIGKTVSKGLKGVTGMVTRFGAMLLPLLTNPVALAVVAVIAIVAGAVYLIVKHWDGIKEGAVKAFKGVMSAWTTLGANLLQGFGLIRGHIATAWNSIADAIKNAWNIIKSHISTSMAAISAAIKIGWNGIKSFMSAILSSISNAITSAWNFIKEFISTTLNNIKSTMTAAWNFIKSTVTRAIKSIQSIIKSVFNAIRSFLSSTMSSIRSNVVGAFNSMLGTARSAANGIRNAIVNAFNVIKNLASKTYGWGADIMGGLVGGIQSGLKKVTSTVSGVAKSVAKTFRNLLGIKSPSRVFRMFGLNIGQGLAIGIDKTQSLVNRASQALSNSIVQPEGMDIPISARVAGVDSKARIEDARSVRNVTTVAPQGDSQVIIQNAQFTIEVEKIHTDDDVTKLRKTIQTVVSDDLYGMAVRNI